MYCRILHDNYINEVVVVSVPCIWRLKIGVVYLFWGRHSWYQSLGIWSLEEIGE